MKEMKWFHNHLKEFLDEKKITIKAIAEEVDIDYIEMLSIIHGEKELEEKIFHQLMTSKIFSEDEKKYVFDVFKKYHVSLEERSQIAYVEKCLNGLYDTLLEKGLTSKLYKNKTVESKKQEKIELLMEQVTAAVLKAYNHKVRESILSGQTSDFFMEFSLPPIDRLLYEVYQLLGALDACIDDHINLKVSIKFNTLMEDGQHASNIVNLSKYIHFLTLNDSVTIHSERLHGEDSYYVLLPKQIIILNDQGTKCKLSETKNDDRLKRAVHNGHNVLGIKYNSVELNDHIYKLTKLGHYPKQSQYTMRYSLSSMSISNSMFKKRIVHTLKSLKLKAFTGAELVIFNKFGFRTKRELEKIRNPESRVAQYIPLQGIESFIKHGYLSDFYELAGSFEPEEIISMLYETLKRIHEGLDLRVFDMDLARDLPFLKVIEYFEIYMDCDQVMIAKHLDPKTSKPPENNLLNVSAKSIEYAIVIEDKEIVEAFKLFYQHIMDMICEDKFKSFMAIKQLALKYFTYSNDPEVLKILEQIIALDQETIEIQVL